MEIEKTVQDLERRHPSKSEYLQAIKEVLTSIKDVYNKHPELEKAKIIEYIVEPKRIVMLRVPRVDDQGEVHVNIGYRVRFNGAIGPHESGLRFHSSVNLSTMKFLGFEQIFKNALTTLPMGGTKGGSDSSIRGGSDVEMMRFYQSFMCELYKHIGPSAGVPARDIGVSGRETGYLFGQYKKLVGRWKGVLTGKGLEYGSSRIRPEATGFGALYFMSQMLQTRNTDIKDKTVAISGFGNVVRSVALKAIELREKVITINGSDSYIYDPNGISGEKIAYMLELYASGDDIYKPHADKFADPEFHKGKKPWEQKADIYLACATQNELNSEDADHILANKPLCVVEVSNTGCTTEAVDKFVATGQLFAPGKAVSVGGVATSGLEMTQNAIHLNWSEVEVDERLHYIMHFIHERCVKYGTQPDGYINYVKGADVAGFMKVAHAMVAQGVV